MIERAIIIFFAFLVFVGVLLNIPDEDSEIIKSRKEYGKTKYMNAEESRLMLGMDKPSPYNRRKNPYNLRKI